MGGKGGKEGRRRGLRECVGSPESTNFDREE